MAYYYVLLALVSFVIFFYSYRDKTDAPTNWPLLGMLPAAIKNYNRINDFFVEGLQTRITFMFKGPWFSDMNILATVDPANVHHVLVKNFDNYVKGPKFNEIFEVFGEGVINTDSHIWKYHRKMGQAVFGNPSFHQFFINTLWEKVDMGLIPVLDHVSKHGLEVDLQDLLSRFTFDNICTMIMGHDPISLCPEFPSVPFFKALEDVEEVILHRFAMPTSFWKFLRWLEIGLEKKCKESRQCLDTFIYKCIAHKRECISKGLSNSKGNNERGVDILTLYMNEDGASSTTGKKDDKFLRDTVLAYIVGGRDTTATALSWFFYLLSENPRAAAKIKEELGTVFDEATPRDERGNYDLSRNFKEVSDKLVYLQAALCEALRLYPPVLFEGKVPIKPDVLPSGHRVEPNTQIAFNLYAMGRIKSIWGDDCNEFKPERWITDKGDLKHEPSHKFLAFNTGPRTCLGKNIALVQMKAVAATIIKNYDIQVVKGHPIVANFSFILRMKYGFKVKVTNSK